jgi:hypothetical protein
VIGWHQAGARANEHAIHTPEAGVRRHRVGIFHQSSPNLHQSSLNLNQSFLNLFYI